jgi:hypothetical protein
MGTGVLMGRSGKGGTLPSPFSNKLTSTSGIIDVGLCPRFSSYRVSVFSSVT